MREDPGRRGVLYAGTETGVYVSLDAGGAWRSLQLNMPVSPVHDLVVKHNDLVVATHGRGFWILDDVTPLRQLAAGIDHDARHLFAPAAAYRIRNDFVSVTGPAGENPRPERSFTTGCRATRREAWSLPSSMRPARSFVRSAAVR